MRKITQLEKYKYAIQLLKELNCPEGIMDELAIWGIFVNNDEVKLHNWEALSGGGVVEGEGKELLVEQIDKEYILIFKEE